MEKKSNSSIDEYNIDNDACNESLDVCDDDDVLHNHLDDDDHEFYEYRDVDDDVDDVDDDDFIDYKLQGKISKLSEDKKIEFGKLQASKMEAKSRCLKHGIDIRELNSRLKILKRFQSNDMNEIKNINAEMNSYFN